MLPDIHLQAHLTLIGDLGSLHDLLEPKSQTGSFKRFGESRQPVSNFGELRLEKNRYTNEYLTISSWSPSSPRRRSCTWSTASKLSSAPQRACARSTTSACEGSTTTPRSWSCSGLAWRTCSTRATRSWRSKWCSGSQSSWSGAWSTCTPRASPTGTWSPRTSRLGCRARHPQSSTDSGLAKESINPETKKHIPYCEHDVLHKPQHSSGQGPEPLWGPGGAGLRASCATACAGRGSRPTRSRSASWRSGTPSGPRPPRASPRGSRRWPRTCATGGAWTSSRSWTLTTCTSSSLPLTAAALCLVTSPTGPGSPGPRLWHGPHQPALAASGSGQSLATHQKPGTELHPRGAECRRHHRWSLQCPHHSPCRRGGGWRHQVLLFPSEEKEKITGATQVTLEWCPESSRCSPSGPAWPWPCGRSRTQTARPAELPSPRGITYFTWDFGRDSLHLCLVRPSKSISYLKQGEKKTPAAALPCVSASVYWVSSAAAGPVSAIKCSFSPFVRRPFSTGVAVGRCCQRWARPGPPQAKGEGWVRAAPSRNAAPKPGPAGVAGGEFLRTYSSRCPRAAAPDLWAATTGPLGWCQVCLVFLCWLGAAGRAVGDKRLKASPRPTVGQVRAVSVVSRRPECCAVRATGAVPRGVCI